MKNNSEIMLSQSFIPRRYGSTLSVDSSATHKSSSSPRLRREAQVPAREINSALAAEKHKRAPSKSLVCNFEAAEPVDILEIRSNASFSDFFAQAVYPCSLTQSELKISPRITGGESSWSPSAETLKNLETTPRLRLQSCPKTTDLLTTRGGLISADSSELIFSEALKTKKIILRNTPSQVNKDSFPFYSLKSQSLSSTGLRVSTIPPQSSISSAAKCSTSGMSKLKDIELSSKFNSNSKTSAVSTPKPPNVLRIEVFPASVSSPESSSPTSDYHSAQFSFDPATASRNNSFNELDDLKCLSNEEGDKDETRQSFRFRDSSTTFTNDLISELQKFDAINALLEETRSKRTFNNGLKAT
ncbi:expressed protein [Phakopsora pachyrhizi]|uniref:Expressed protein n=1 Tax=Phakopsora pachyrhizi TaxID=170000 RepID=A0AAV0BHL3_PHAPC|nr:expressed protein [Phakopsora pachyrhizi]